MRFDSRMIKGIAAAAAKSKLHIIKSHYLTMMTRKNERKGKERRGCCLVISHLVERNSSNDFKMNKSAYMCVCMI